MAVPMVADGNAGDLLPAPFALLGLKVDHAAALRFPIEDGRPLIAGRLRHQVGHDGLHHRLGVR